MRGTHDFRFHRNEVTVHGGLLYPARGAWDVIDIPGYRHGDHIRISMEDKPYRCRVEIHGVVAYNWTAKADPDEYQVIRFLFDGVTYQVEHRLRPDTPCG